MRHLLRAAVVVCLVVGAAPVIGDAATAGPGEHAQRAQGGGLTKMQSPTLGVSASAAAPTNGIIVFTDTSLGNLYEMNPDTTVHGLSLLGAIAGPSWSPRANKIAFSHFSAPGEQDIYVMNADGSGVTNLTNTTGFDGAPAWSPDGTRIVFDRQPTAGSNEDIYLMNADGTGVTRLTSAPGSTSDQSPSWSPDGTQIIFSNSGRGDVFSIHPDGTGQVQLTSFEIPFSGTANSVPHWSPDGTKIALKVPTQSGTGGISVMNADGSNRSIVFDHEILDFSWSPDGTRFAVVDINFNLSLMNADGTNQTFPWCTGAGQCSRLAQSVEWGPAMSIAAAGARPTRQLMDQVLAGAGQYNVDAQQSPAKTVPGDATCGDVTYGTTAASGIVASPPSTDDGRDALRDSANGTYPDSTTDANRGCLDIARVDQPPRPIGPTGDNATFEYYDYALDAVTWASPSLQAPATLTLTQLRSIYNCTITNWSQLAGGGPGHIQRVLPQPGSGTRNVFISNVLGFDPTTISSADCPAVTQGIQENSGAALFGPTDAALYQQAILPYSAGSFVYQATNATNPTLDLRAGVRPGGLTQSGTPTYAVRWTGSSWMLNNATIVGGRTVNDAVTNGGTGSPPPSVTVSSATANFSDTDVGMTIAGTNIPPGAVITRVGSSTTVQISIPAVASATNGSLTIGRGVVTETNPNIEDPADTTVFPGVRYLANVLDTTQPSYVAARDLVGFEDYAFAKRASTLCTGAFASTISSNGFLPLAAHHAPNDDIDVTCRLQTP